MKANDLGRDARKLYKQLLPSVNEPTMLFAFCSAYQDLLDSIEDIKEQGRYQVSAKGWRAPSAAIVNKQKALSSMNSLCQRLGLDLKKHLNLESDDGRWEKILKKGK